MKRIHYYSSSDEMEKIAHDNILISLSKNNQVDYDKITDIQPLFYIFVTLCLNYRKHKDRINSSVYLQHMIIQSCMQTMHSVLNFMPSEASRYTEIFLHYLTVNYLLENAEFINWSILRGMDREEFLGKLL